MSSEETRPGVVSLAAAVAAVRRELAVALGQAEGKGIRLGVSSLELDLQVEFAAGASESAAAELHVAQVTADPPAAVRHRLSLSLRPLDLTSGTPDELFIGDVTKRHGEQK